MPCVYVKARESPRAGVTFSPSPTIRPDRIGIIGSTQGVNESPRPAAKKNPSTAMRLPLRSMSASLSCAETKAVDVGVGVAAAPLGPPAWAVPVPGDGRTTLTVLVIGG